MTSFRFFKHPRLQPHSARCQHWQRVAQRGHNDDQVDNEENSVGDECHGLPVFGQDLFAVLLVHSAFAGLG